MTAGQECWWHLWAPAAVPSQGGTSAKPQGPGWGALSHTNPAAPASFLLFFLLKWPISASTWAPGMIPDPFVNDISNQAQAGEQDLEGLGSIEQREVRKGAAWMQGPCWKGEL